MNKEDHEQDVMIFVLGLLDELKILHTEREGLWIKMASCS